MAVKTNKSIFYHIPKTGGIFVKEAMRRALPKDAGYARARGDNEIDEGEIAHWRRFLAHSLQLKREHRTQWDIRREKREGLFSFAFVREPLEWYRSFWAHRKAAYDVGEFAAAFPLDFAWDVDFEKFIDNSIRMYPMGFASILYQCFLGKDGDAFDFVGKQENLREDLVKALTLSGEYFDKKEIMELKRFNLGASKSKFDGKLEINRNLEWRLRKRETWILDTFYK